MEVAFCTPGANFFSNLEIQSEWDGVGSPFFIRFVSFFSEFTDALGAEFQLRSGRINC